MMQSVKYANLGRLEKLAHQLGSLVEELVFLGGCTTALFITEEAAPDVRSTLDVDCIVDVLSLSDYHKIEKRLTQQGFKKSLEDEVICRWRIDQIILDVMPTDEKILGFSNIWYKDAIRHALKYWLSEKTSIRAVAAPYFIGTKLEAFRNRGSMDFMASHDFEDIVSVIDGRPELIDEIEYTDPKLKSYLKSAFNVIYKNRSFHDALAGHFIHYGNSAEDRIEFFIEKIKKIIG